MPIASQRYHSHPLSSAPHYEPFHRRPRILPFLQPHWPRGYGHCSATGMPLSYYLSLCVFIIASRQAQLAQTLAQAIQQSASGQYTQRANRAQTCNTPIAQTPSSSMSFADAQRFYETVPRRGSQHDDYPYPATEQMEEDERMVEDLLMPQSSSATNGASSFEQHAYQNHSPSYTYTSPFTNDPYPNSSFATTDPFYQQAAKSHSMNTSPSSIFSQAGRPSHHSPFLAAQKQK